MFIVLWKKKKNEVITVHGGFVVPTVSVVYLSSSLNLIWDISTVSFLFSNDELHGVFLICQVFKFETNSNNKMQNQSKCSPR